MLLCCVSPLSGNPVKVGLHVCIRLDTPPMQQRFLDCTNLPSYVLFPPLFFLPFVFFVSIFSFTFFSFSSFLLLMVYRTAPVICSSWSLYCTNEPSPPQIHFLSQIQSTDIELYQETLEYFREGKNYHIPLIPLLFPVFSLKIPIPIPFRTPSAEKTKRLL